MTTVNPVDVNIGAVVYSNLRVYECKHVLNMTHIDSRDAIDGVVVLNQIPAHMWCPTSLMVNGVETQYPVPEPALPLNFINSTGMSYEAEEVRQCLLKGKDIT